MLKLPVMLGAMTVALGGIFYEGVAISAPKSLFDDVNIGLFSVGGRATYFNPTDGHANWFGGGQLRLHMFRYLAVEGSVDYGQTDMNSAIARTFTVQGSALVYPLGIKRISPFILGGAGLYFTHLEGPGGFDKAQGRLRGHVGGGLQIFLNEHFSLDSTYRHIWIDKVEVKYGTRNYANFEGAGHMVTFGLNLHF